MTDISHIRDWVLFLKSIGSPEGYINRGELLDKHGLTYAVGPRTFLGPRGRRHGCFQNSAEMAFDNDQLIYVEGYATVIGVPIEHAWVFNKKDSSHVIETTMEKPDFDMEFYGIPFKTEYVRKTALKTGVWGIISHTNMDLLKKTTKMGQIIYTGRGPT